MKNIALALALAVLFFVPDRGIAQETSMDGAAPDSVSAEEPMQGGVLLPRPGGRAEGRGNAYKEPFRFPNPGARAEERANAMARFKRTGGGEGESVRALGQENRAEWKVQKKEMRAEWKEKRGALREGWKTKKQEMRAEWKEKRETLRGEWKEQKREARDAFRQKKEELRLEWKERRGGLEGGGGVTAPEESPAGMAVEGENLRIRDLGTGRRTMLERRVSPRLRRR